MRTTLVTVLALAASPSLAQSPPPGSVEQLAWMAGCWGGEEKGTASEECWLAPKGGIMLGLHRDTRASRPGAFFEFLRIAPHEGGLAYLAQPRGQAPTAFKLTSATDREVVFENPAHDFPKRIRYWLDEKGRLHARVDAGPAGGGSEKAQEWTWEKRDWTPSRP